MDEALFPRPIFGPLQPRLVLARSLRLLLRLGHRGGGCVVLVGVDEPPMTALKFQNHFLTFCQDELTETRMQHKLIELFLKRFFISLLI